MTQFTLFTLLFLIFALCIVVFSLLTKNKKTTQLLLNSRQLFLRTIMHELKTPLAKGRIASELISDQKQKERMSLIFEKLEFNINEFSKIEEILSKQYKINKKSYQIDTIINSSIEMLMVDSNKDKIIFENIYNQELLVDLELFSRAIKNLIDNALKYSIDKKVLISYQKNQIKFISTGDKLSKPLEDYLKPFHNDTYLMNHGMGIGLYIVNEILHIHNKTLDYQYKNKQNIFIIR